MEIPSVTTDELRRKIDDGESFVLVDALAPMVFAHSNVRHYPGGKDEWRDAGLPLERAGKPFVPS